jgi:hypothetical protein
VEPDRSGIERIDLARGRIRRRVSANKPNETAAWRLATGEDLEHALRAAERLLSQAENRHRHGQNVTNGLYSIMIGTGLSFIASLAISLRFLTFGYGTTENATAIITAIVTVVVLAVTVGALFQQRQRMYMDNTLKIATRLAAMIDELLVEVAEREKWSQLRIESTELRLSVFPVYKRRRQDYKSD